MLYCVVDRNEEVVKYQSSLACEETDPFHLAIFDGIELAKEIMDSPDAIADGLRIRGFDGKVVPLPAPESIN